MNQLINFTIPLFPRMLERYTYDELVALYFELYIKDYGELKFNRVAEKILTSNKVKELIDLSEFHAAPVTAKQILYTINSVGFFVFRSNRTQALGALLILHKWNEEVNTELHLLNQPSLKLITMEILKELKAHWVKIGNDGPGIKDNGSNKGTISVTNDRSGNLFFCDNLFFLKNSITYGEFISMIKGEFTEYPPSHGLRGVSHEHAFKNAPVELNAPFTMRSYFRGIGEFFLDHQVLLFDNFETAKGLFDTICLQMGLTHQQWLKGPADRNAAISNDSKYQLTISEFLSRFSSSTESDHAGELILRYNFTARL